MSALRSSSPPGRNQAVSLDRLVELLAPALGREKSRELVGSSASTFGHATGNLNLDQALQILAALGGQPGIVGVSARLAKTRLVTPQKSEVLNVQRSLAPAHEAAAAATPVEVATIEVEEIVTLLAHSLGTEKSREIVSAATAQLGFSGKALTADRAQAVLEQLAKSEGVIGVTSRFAKARLLLRFKRGRA